MTGSAVGAAAPAGVLRVVTLNLWGENGPHERRLDLVAAELSRLAPDVVALQEVREVPGRLANQAQTLARALTAGTGARAGSGAYVHAFAPSTEWGGGTEGLAFLSRLPVLESSSRPLPHASPTEGRVVLSVLLDAPGGPAWFHTAHLSYRQHEGRQREDQVLAIDAEVTARAGAGNQQPQVLLGDFNTVPESDEIRWLGGLCTLGGRRVFYQDAWAACRPGEPGVTWARDNTFRARMAWLRADRRIDYVFVTAARRDGRGDVRDARLVCDRADADGVFPSDHYGVLADVQMVADPPDAASMTSGAAAATAEKPGKG